MQVYNVVCLTQQKESLLPVAVGVDTTTSAIIARDKFFHYVENYLQYIFQDDKYDVDFNNGIIKYNCILNNNIYLSCNADIPVENYLFSYKDGVDFLWVGISKNEVLDQTK